MHFWGGFFFNQTYLEGKKKIPNTPHAQSNTQKNYKLIYSLYIKEFL